MRNKRDKQQTKRFSFSSYCIYHARKGGINMPYPDWVEDRFGDDVPDWAEDRWGDDDDDDSDDDDGD